MTIKVNLPLISMPSPNFDSRDGQRVDMLVLHYTGMKDGVRALQRLTDKESNVSAHYVVDELGKIFALVEEEHRAWHAGKAFWRGHTNINQRSIGIEIVNPGHEFGYRPFPEVQMQTVIALCQDVLSRHPVEPRNVAGHSDIAPTRKADPGELFDWKRLASMGFGLWHERGVNQDFQALQDDDPEVYALQLAQYGYDISDLKQTIIAFQRHFRPENITGQWDGECQFVLNNLLAGIDSGT